MADSDYDVAIVGYGPVGAMAALLLADAGLRVVVVERETEIIDIPRAVNIDGEIVRAFQSLGHGDEIEATTQPPRIRDEVAFTNSKREPYFTAAMEAHHNGYRDMAFFDQPELEAKIRELIDQQGKVTLRLGHEVTGIGQDSDQVSLETRAVGGTETERIDAAYVIGCDGASSFVREAMGIEWQSLGYDQDWLVIDIVVEDPDELTILTMQICDPERLATYICVKDPNRRWEFQMLPGETREEMLKPEKIGELLEDWVPSGRYSIRRAAVYQFHAATAESWREGRVFLAGDAAHQTPPFLGQGLNAGFRDVVNLAWKLPLVIDGTCEDALLDTYAAERDAHAHDLVDWAVAIGKMMENLAAQEAGKPAPHVVDSSSGYGQGRAAPPLHGGAITIEQVRDESSTGYLLRQPTVRTPDGSECRLDELLGGGFAVVGRDSASLGMSDQSRAFLDRIGARCVSLEGLKVVSNEVDRLFDAHSAAIVRPDRYVFGVADQDWDLDRLVASLEEKLAVRGESMN
jgi:2-polyprenyl-6-methoxyphenol hydroxylase-like FAD-dependent oxidoreductase